MTNKTFIGTLVGGLLTLIAIIAIMASATVVPAGHVGVVSTFGKVDETTLPEGLHFINPFANVIDMSVQNKEITINDIGVPSQDQLTTELDFTVNWKLDGSQASKVYRETGDIESVKNIYIVPKLRSLVRETGKSIERAEDFYQESTQAKIQTAMLERLSELSEKGVIIEDVLIRKVDLPRQVAEGVIKKKEREQEAEKQQAELKRFKFLQDQKDVQAKAELEAAKTEAEKRKVNADAKAYEVETAAKAKAKAIEIQAQGNAKAIELESAATAKGIELQAKALSENPKVIEFKKAERWNGQLPKFQSGGGTMIPMIDLKNE